ncbi:hypothetical protein LTR48_001020 [Friedmanniomyces endolithicus]|uniref:Thioesterase domain-containing protein n=1 Tax=Rachicladosporium monterosium TaxID=1507873 RepID=A0ABR0LEJ0_9PEZI|nr:hypothetical protein LTR48_001020 [Friedmanniomyces endolithicus]KAK5147632.1 hypothetical protein LTR32_000961 [Rachicladosporium monterosium]
MALEDSKAAFLRIPWAAALLNRPNVICRVPGSRQPKQSLEDSLFAEILKTSRTINSCIAFYAKPSDSDGNITEVSTLITIGDGMNGHPNILHGGIVASIIDEAMGILQSFNHERDHMTKVGKGLAQGESPPQAFGSFTATLNIKYLKPVHTPDSLLVTARYTRREGRKEWIHAEVKQHHSHGEDDYGEQTVPEGISYKSASVQTQGGWYTAGLKNSGIINECNSTLPGVVESQAVKPQIHRSFFFPRRPRMARQQRFVSIGPSGLWDGWQS